MIKPLVAPECELRAAEDVVVGQRDNAISGFPAQTVGPTARGVADRRRWRVVLVLGLVAAAAAMVVPFAPVVQDRVTVTWPAAGSDPARTAGAIPLMPYQPVQLTATVPCGGTADRVLLSTVPLQPDPGVPVLPGLRVQRDGGALVVRSDGREVTRAGQPPGACVLEVRSDPARTWVTVNGRGVGEVAGDVRPVVAGAFTELPSTAGLRLRLVTDTRFQSSMTLGKAILVALSVLGLLGALLSVARLDRRSRWIRWVPGWPSRWWRLRWVDVVVGAALVLWAAIGPINVDDGYIIGIVRAWDANGYIGNLHRWLNAPEAPFGWFYDLLGWWSRVSAVPVWMRIPSTVLAVVCWLVLSRGLLPRLGSFAARPATVWVAAAAFGLWWLPFNLTLRAEPWIAVAGLVTVLAVERALVTRRLLPVLLGLVVAGAATTLAPTGIVAFTPFVAGLVALLRALRQRPDLPRLTLLVLVIAAPASALLLAFADQTAASVLEATRIRYLIGGGLPWFEELQRYTSLLTPGSIEGPLQRRMPVLLTLLALAGMAWLLPRQRVTGLAPGPVSRLQTTLMLSMVALTFVPTKWTNHFGALAGVGSAVLLVAVYAWGRQALRDQRCPARSLAGAAIGTAALAITGGIALAGFNQWPYVSNDGITWGTMAPRLGGHAVSTIVLGGGLVLAAITGGMAAWALAGGRRPQIARRVPAPGLLALVLILATIALQLSTVARAAIRQRHSYTLAADTLSVLSHLTSTEPSCGMADKLRVETNPRAGLLPPAAIDHGTLHDFTPTAGPIGDTLLPGWVTAPSGRLAHGSTPWYRLDISARRGAAPVVITISGNLHPGDTLTAEFGHSHPNTTVTPPVSVPLADPPGAPAARDIRLLVPDPTVDLVRLSVSAYRDPATVPLAFSPPRTPHTTPMTAVLPPGTQAIVDWPVAFPFPCLTIAATPDGTATLPQWRLSPPASDAGDIITAPQTGGPFTTPRALIRATRLPVYLTADPLRDVLTLDHWQPLTTYTRPDTSHHDDTVNGWQHHGHLHAPGVDQPTQ